MDLLPTLAELADVEVVTRKPLDGISVASLLRNPAIPWPDRTLVHHWKEKVSVRTQRFRLDYQGQLYDIDVDRGSRLNSMTHSPRWQPRFKQS